MPQSNILLIIACLLLLAGCVARKNSVINPVKQQSLDLVLIAYDNGDGRSFRNLLPELTNRKIHWHLIAFGPAADLFEPGPNITRLNDQVPPDVSLQWKENRRATLPQKITQQLIDHWKPTVVLTGMAHTGQAELTARWWQQGAWTIAFYDNFESPDKQSWVQPWLEQKPPVEEVLVPSKRLTKSFPKELAQSKGISAIAHPILVEWRESFHQSEPQSLKDSLSLSGKPIILVAGGYGERYNNSLNVIAEAAKLRPDLQWLVAPHPRNRGEQEQALLNSDNPPPLQIITNEPTIRLASIADLVISHKSTVGWLASQLGVSTLFVRPEEEQEYLLKNRVKIVNNSSSLLNAIHRELDQPPSALPSHSPELPYLVDLIQQRLVPPPAKPIQVDYLEDSGQ